MLNFNKIVPLPIRFLSSVAFIYFFPHVFLSYVAFCTVFILIQTLWERCAQ